MHHFGCVVPSYESLEIIKYLAGKQVVVEIGSGNGYWACMLRRMGVIVHAVDNLQSEYRTLWIGSTWIKDGEKYLKDGKGCKDAVLLLVYPIVSSDFTSRVLDAYKGDAICVAGTQNRSGHTAFRDRTIDEYMKEEKADYEKTIQIPLPSFPGKDEALYIFERQKI